MKDQLSSFGSSLITRIAIIFLCTAAGAAWLAHTGPVHAIRITTELEEYAPYGYMISAFPILGMLVADAVESLARNGFSRSTFEIAAAILILLVLSNLRLGMRLPISGHAMVATYLVLRRGFWSRPLRGFSLLELLTGILILGMIIYLKLTRWTDPITLLAGCAIAYLLIAIGSRIRATSVTKSFE